MSKTYKPGEKVPTSGQAAIRGAGVERTVVKGERFPPTPKPGQTYKIVDKTKTR